MAKKRLIKLEENTDTLFVRKAIPNCSANDIVVVDEGYSAIVIKNGQLLQSLEAGKHQLLKFGKSKDLYEVVFFPKTSKIKMLWGTKEQFSFRDPIEDVILRVGANGEIDIQIISPRKFFLELGNKKENFTVADLKDSVQTKLISYLEEFIAKYMLSNGLSFDVLDEKKNIVADEIKPFVSDKMENDFGLKVASLTINGVLIPSQYINQLIKAREKRLELKEGSLKKVIEEEKQEENKKISNEVASQSLADNSQPEQKKEKSGYEEEDQEGMLLL